MDVPASAVTSRHRPPGRPPVPKERIVASALKIVDQEGAEALSLRALAQQLDSSTATLYRHFASRAELINQVVDHTFSGLSIDAEELQTLSWDEACRAMATWTFERLRRHPNVAPLLLTQAPAGPNARALRELALQVLLDAGFPPPVAARCYATLARFVLGFAIQLNGEDAAEEALTEAFRGPASDTFPATAAAAHVVPLDEEFSFGLDLLLTGLAHTWSR